MLRFVLDDDHVKSLTLHQMIDNVGPIQQRKDTTAIIPSVGATVLKLCDPRLFNVYVAA